MVGSAWFSPRLRGQVPDQQGTPGGKDVFYVTSGPLEGAAGKPDADFARGQLGLWEWAPGWDGGESEVPLKAGCGKSGFS